MCRRCRDEERALKTIESSAPTATKSVVENLPQQNDKGQARDKAAAKSVPVNLPEQNQGDTRDKAAAEIGISGKTYFFFLPGGVDLSEYFFRASFNNRRMASDRVLIRLLKRKSSKRFIRSGSIAKFNISFLVGMDLLINHFFLIIKKSFVDFINYTI